nr:hypothetical protein [uncultured Vibrio sp.]
MSDKISAEERWHVESIIKNLRINHPLSSSSTFDDCLRFFSKLESVNKDLIGTVKGALGMRTLSSLSTDRIDAELTNNGRAASLAVSGKVTLKRLNNITIGES